MTKREREGRQPDGFWGFGYKEGPLGIVHLRSWDIWSCHISCSNLGVLSFSLLLLSNKTNPLA